MAEQKFIGSRFSGREFFFTTSANVKNMSWHSCAVRSMPKPGLSDGIFSNQKSRFGQILEGIAMEDVAKLYGHFVYFKAIL
jgi:hypothetical protein